MMTIFRIAFRNLLQARRRSLLLGLAVALVAALFLTLRVVSGSVAERMIESATTLSAGHVNIGGFFKARKKGSDPLISDRAGVKEAVRKSVPEATTIIDRHRGWGRLVGPQSSFNVGLSGIEYEDEGRFFQALQLAPESSYKDGGRDQALGNFADLKKPNSVLIFAAQAKKLGVTIGDNITMVVEGAKANTVDLTVVAIAADIGFMSNWNIFVPRRTVLDLYRIQDNSTGVVMVYLPNPDRATAVMERLRADLTKAGFTVMDHDPRPFFFKFDKVSGEDWLGQRLDLTIWSDEVSFVLWVTRALDLVSFFVVAILAMIIVGGIVNSMWMAVRERTKEIGTMRAIGAPKTMIVEMFVAEACLLGIIAAAIGASLGVGGILLVNMLKIPVTNEGVRLFLMTNTLKFSVHSTQFLSTLVLFAAVTGFASLYPALKAAGLRPVEALMSGK
ncbi:MAG: hypothetical protein RL011_121 [Pseudomonadota bacterium]